MKSVNPVDVLCKKSKVQDKDIAEALGTSKAAVSRWRKKGAIPIKRVLELSARFKLNPAQLDQRFKRVSRSSQKDVQL